MQSSSRTLNYVLFSCEGASETDDRMFIVYSGASMHNAEQGDLNSRYNGYFEKVQNPISDLPRPETVQINEYAQVFVHDLYLFATVQLLDETLAVLLLHVLCSKHRVENSEIPQLTQNGKSITCIMDNSVLLVVSRLSSYSSSILSSTSR